MTVCVLICIIYLYIFIQFNMSIKCVDGLIIIRTIGQGNMHSKELYCSTVQLENLYLSLYVYLLNISQPFWKNSELTFPRA